MGTSVVLGPLVIGEKAAKEEARRATSGAGGGAIQLGPGILGVVKEVEEETTKEPVGLTIAQVRMLLDEDPNMYEKILAMEEKLDRPRRTVLRLILALDNGTLKHPMSEKVVTALKLLINPEE